MVWKAIILCKPMAFVKGWSIWETMTDTAHSLLAHLGTQKTLTHLKEHVWWSTMAEDVAAFFKSALFVRWVRYQHQSQWDSFLTLEVPTRPQQDKRTWFCGSSVSSTNSSGSWDTMCAVIAQLKSIVRRSLVAKSLSITISKSEYRKCQMPLKA